MFESVKIREDFRALIPPLSADERQGLERSILEYGCRDALLTWNGWIVDGHNRYEICAGNGIEFRTEEMEFEDENAVKVWMIDNQLSRRNLTVFVKAELALKRKSFFAEKAKENLGGDRKSIDWKSSSQNSANLIDTRAELARLAGTSHDTISKVERILKSNNEEAKQAVRSGDVSINHAFQMVTNKPIPVNIYTGNNEWYTPEIYINAAREVMGSIDVDPASNDFAQQKINAGQYFTIDDSGITKDWVGNVWLNPPYSASEIREFVDKLLFEYSIGNTRQAIILTNNSADTAWFHLLANACEFICFTRGRINFYNQVGEFSSPTNGQSFFYFGANYDEFRRIFSEFGLIVSVCR